MSAESASHRLGGAKQAVPAIIPTGTTAPPAEAPPSDGAARGPYLPLSWAGLVAYLRSMLAIAWSAVRHPRKTTVIDLSTGKVLRHE